MSRELFEIIEGLERWAEYHGRKSDQDVADLAGRLRKLFTKEDRMIQTPEEFKQEISRILQQNHWSTALTAAITTRDAQIRAEAREEKRLEVVAEFQDRIKVNLRDRKLWTQDHPTCFVETVFDLPSLQPPKPAIDPRALEIATKWTGLPADRISVHELASLISDRVATWKEDPDGN